MTETVTSSDNTDLGNRFATGFKRTTGDVFVFGALFIGALAAGYGLVFGIDGYFIVTAVCLASAWYYSPYLDTKNAQLGADSRGIYVGGLGLIDWAAIENVSLIRQAVRRVERAAVHITLNRPLDQSLLVADKAPWWANLKVRNWSFSRDGVVKVRLEQFKATSNEIEADLMPFWQKQ